MRSGLRLMLVGMALAMGLGAAGATGTQAPDRAICRRLERAQVEARSTQAHAAAAAAQIPRLCFEECRAGDIPASRFWGDLSTPEQQAIHDELVQFSWYLAPVTELDLGAGAPHITRILRTVGTAGCMRDTYLQATADGYSLVISPSLAALSVEAAYCGRGELSFTSLGDRHYAIDTHNGAFTVYAVGAGMTLTKLCAVPHAQ